MPLPSGCPLQAFAEAAAIRCGQCDDKSDTEFKICKLKQLSDILVERQVAEFTVSSGHGDHIFEICEASKCSDEIMCTASLRNS